MTGGLEPADTVPPAKTSTTAPARMRCACRTSEASCRVLNAMLRLRTSSVVTRTLPARPGQRARHVAVAIVIGVSEASLTGTARLATPSCTLSSEASWSGRTYTRDT
jgi:hypothetical protein